jgi:hypothetical protein
MKRSIALGSLGFLSWAALVLALATSLNGQQPAPAPAQQTQTDAFAEDFDVLDAFLPGDKDPRDEDAKVMVMINCTVCHGPKDTKERISLRAGGDVVFWTGLIRKMNTSWNARIQEEDIAPIATYLAKYFGPASKKGASGANARRR